jgi:hypothetical protein
MIIVEHIIFTGGENKCLQNFGWEFSEGRNLLESLGCIAG